MHATIKLSPRVKNAELSKWQGLQALASKTPPAFGLSDGSKTKQLKGKCQRRRSIKLNIFIFVQWKKLLINEQILGDVQLHMSLGESQFVQVILGDILVYHVPHDRGTWVSASAYAGRLALWGRGEHLGGDCGQWTRTQGVTPQQSDCIRMRLDPLLS